MIKKFFILIFVTIFLNLPAYSGEKSSGPKADGRQDLSFLNVKNSNYKKGFDALKQATKYEKKGKTQKAQKRFNDTIKFFLLANEENPNEPSILNYLGFSYKKVGDFLMAEIYYTQGLEIDPKNIDTNRYLGELYVELNKIEKANKRLKILGDCNCEEYSDLANIIKQGVTKY